MEFRELRSDEIDVRIQSIKKDRNNNVYAIFLLYKDARCDMNILDEKVGSEGWKRNHELINGNLFCNVSIYDSKIGEWITKQDVGKESNTEKEKGQASDSFKRACVNWGIGRELYTSPFIMVYLNEGEFNEQKGRFNSNLKLAVKEIKYTDRKISALTLIDNYENERYKFPNSKGTKQKQTLKGNNGNTSVPVLEEEKKEIKMAKIHQFYTTRKKSFGPVLKSFLNTRKLSELPEVELDGILELIKTSKNSFVEDKVEEKQNGINN